MTATAVKSELNGHSSPSSTS